MMSVKEHQEEDGEDTADASENENEAACSPQHEEAHQTTQIYITNTPQDKKRLKQGGVQGKSIIQKSPMVILKRKKKSEDAEKGMARRERVKTTCTVSARMKQVVAQMITCSLEEYTIALQQTTVFAFKSQQSEIITCFLEEMRRENGTLFQNKQALLEYISTVYDHTQQLVMMHQPKTTKS